MKTALISGASTGIGKEIAIKLAGQGIHTVLTARSEDKLQETLKIILSQSGSGEIITADLSNLENINSLIKKVQSKHNEIDILINVAGIWHGDSEVYAKRNYDTFDQRIIVDTINVGTLAPMLLAHSLIPLMPEKSKIVNISGTFESGATGWLPYYVSKKAIEDFTVGLAYELNDKDIQVNCVSPSDVATDAYKKFFPEYIENAIDPESVAKQVAYLCSSNADTISGKVFVVKKDQEPYEGFHT